MTEPGSPTLTRTYGSDAKGAWRELGRVFRHYLTTGKPDTVTEQIYDQIEKRWRFTRRHVYDYDAEGRVVQIQNQGWDFGSDSWQVQTTYVNEFLRDHLLARQTVVPSIYADSTITVQQLSSSYAFSGTVLEGATLTYFAQHPQSGEWTPISREALTTKDSSAVEVYAYWVGQENKWRTLYRYTYAGANLPDVIYAYAMFTLPSLDLDNTTEVMQAGEWQPTRRLRTTYTPEGLPSAKIQERWMVQDSSWQAYHRERYMTHSGTPSDVFEENWDDRTGKWVLISHRIYSYEPINAPTRPEPIPDFTLLGNAPNPFGAYTRINYVLKTRTHVTLRVFDVLGREIDTLVDEVLEEGVHAAYFDATRLPSGTYFYVLTTPSYRQARAMTLISELPTHYQF